MEESEEESKEEEEGLFPPLPHEERIKAAKMIRHLDLFMVLPFRSAWCLELPLQTLPVKRLRPVLMAPILHSCRSWNRYQLGNW